MRVTDRRDQITATAIALIGEHGFPACTFKRITEAAGLSSTRLVSYHFTDKDDLLMSVLTAAIERADALLAARLAGATDRAEMLRAYIESQVDLLHQHPDHARAIVEIGQHVPAFAPVLRDFRVGRLERQLAQGRDEGSFAGLGGLGDFGDLGDFGVTVTAQSIRSAIEGAAERSRDGLDMAAYGRAVADLFLRALTPGPRPAAGR
jgi:AcrR family transcriptional regulator